MDSSIGELLLSGAKLMLVGMGIVYLFLALLVWVIGTTSKLIHRFSHEPSVYPPVPDGTVVQAESADGFDAELVAMISAAIHHYESN